MPHTVYYEQPLNERMRVLLRLEFLFQQIAYAMKESASTWESRTALHALLDVFEITQHNEIKSQLIKELERHTAILNRLRLADGVHAATLDAVLAEIVTVTERLHHHLDGWMMDAVRQTDFLSAIQKRSRVAGGMCRFDLPALHHWLQAPHAVRHQYLQQWLDPFAPMQEGITLILRLVRESVEPIPAKATSGFFQRTLDSALPTQMIRVLLQPDQCLFPEISAGKHRITIRFLEQPDPNVRATQSIADVNFGLSCCVL